MTERPRVLAAMAHPDDAEFLCAGTLRLLVECGWAMRCITLSGGDLGAPAGTREAIRETRLAEAERSARLLGGSYAWAGLDDLSIHYCPEQLAKVTDALRAFAPDVVITHSPDCYMIDHEETARLVRMACFAAGVPLLATRSAATGKGVPALYYADAIEGKDKFGRPVTADFWIDVTSVFSIREEALACHASQRDWLRAHHGADDYLEANRQFAREQGSRCGARNAEGFRQHLGHGYPRRNVLGEALEGHLRNASVKGPTR
jgi:LmbE family N-acetylglucosaminyl deacetylase